LHFKHPNGDFSLSGVWALKLKAGRPAKSQSRLKNAIEKQARA
jgi:hypothetical protein